MDCRETQTLLDAFHDGELREDDRARVELHLRGCPECGRLLADLARADEAVIVSDPGPAYWDRFNERLADRIEREAQGPKAAVLRPKQGWIRQQLRYLVPAVAAAALVVMVVRYGGRDPGAPAPTLPPAVSVTEPSALDSARQRVAKREMEPAAAPPASIAREHPPAMAREGQDRLADGYRSDESLSKAQAERKKTAEGETAAMEPRPAAGAESASAMKAGRASSPCEKARTLYARELLREAEAAQRECLKQDPSPLAQEKGLIFLAELLDRQARFADADAVLAEVHRQFPKSLPLDLYRQQRPMVQQQTPIPVPR